MILFLLICLQELGVQTPDSISAQITFTEGKKEITLTDLKIKGPDPYFLTLDYRSETEFVPIYTIAQIKKDKKKTNGYIVLFLSGETVEARIRGIILQGSVEGPVSKTIAVKLRDIDQIFIYSAKQLKSCINCSYETKSSYWFCPRCGHELSIGAFEEIQPEEETQPSLIRYRVDTRDQ